MAEKVHSIKLYSIIYVVLLLLLGTTIGFAYIDIGKYPNNLIAIAIAIAKATLIILFFMHIKNEKWITWYFASAGFIWLCIMIALTMNDYLTRNHPLHDDPKGEPVFISEGGMSASARTMATGIGKSELLGNAPVR